MRDLDLNILFWNKGAEKIYGWTAEEVVGTRNFFKESVGQFEAALKRCFQMESGTESFVKRVVTVLEIIVESRWTLVRDEKGQPNSILVINTDVTEKKRMEAQFLCTENGIDWHSCRRDRT